MMRAVYRLVDTETFSPLVAGDSDRGKVVPAFTVTRAFSLAAAT